MAGIFRRSWFPPQRKRFAKQVSIANVDITLGLGLGTITGFAPAVTGGSSGEVAPGVSSVTITGHAVDFDNGTGNEATPDAGSVVITGLAPTFHAQPPEMFPGLGTVTITGKAPAITGDASAVLAPFVGRVFIQGFRPEISGELPPAGGAADARRKYLDWKARQKRKASDVEIKPVSAIPPGTLSFMDLLAFLEAERQAELSRPALSPHEQALDDAEVERLLMEDA